MYRLITLVSFSSGAIDLEWRRSRRLAIVGAGVSGLAACKHALERASGPSSSRPTGRRRRRRVARTIASTRLQTPRPLQYSDFPWPPGVTDLYPDHDQVTAYLRSYAERFGVLECVRFGCRVAGMEYAAAGGEEEVMAWEHWAGNGRRSAPAAAVAAHCAEQPQH